MPIWTVPGVEERPSVTLSNWKLIDVDHPHKTRFGRHLLGYDVEEHECRISSQILQIDWGQRLVATRSGRLYRLRGGPGAHPDAEYLLQKWLRLNNIGSFKMVPFEEIRQHLPLDPGPEPRQQRPAEAADEGGSPAS